MLGGDEDGGAEDGGTGVGSDGDGTDMLDLQPAATNNAAMDMTSSRPDGRLKDMWNTSIQENGNATAAPSHDATAAVPATDLTRAAPAALHDASCS